MRKAEQLMFETIAIKGNIGYASAYEMNGLYEVNISSGECTFIANFDEPITYMRLHSRAVRIKDKVFFVPGSGSNLSVFDVNDKSLRAIPIPAATAEVFKFYNTYMKFIDAIHHGNYLWLIPSTYPGILRMDLDTYEFQNFNSWIPGDGYMFRAKACVEGNSILIPNGKSNLVLKFNLNNQTSQLYTIGNLNKGSMCMKKIGANYYMAPRGQGAIVAWNPSLDSAKEYVEFPISFEPGSCVFSDIYTHDGKIYFTPMDANMSVVLDNDKLLEDRSDWKKCDDHSFVYKMFETNTHVYYQEYKHLKYRRSFRVKISDLEVTEVDFRIVNSEEAYRSAFGKTAATREVVYDNGFYCPSDLLGTLA